MMGPTALFFQIDIMDARDGATPAIPRLSATVLLLREREAAMEVFMVVRHQQVDFASGALVFPGGKLAEGDRDPRVLERCTGADGLSADRLALRIAAIREVFEECGLLLARARGEPEFVDAARLAALGKRYRMALDRGEIGMAELLEAEDLSLACEMLLPFAHWITPAFMPKRFDTHFYLAVAPPEQVALHDGRELVDSLWITPADALRRAEAGELTLVPATLLNLQKLGRNRTLAQALAAAKSEPIVTVLPETVPAPGKILLRIPAEAGYGVTEFELPSAP